MHHYLIVHTKTTVIYQSGKNVKCLLPRHAKRGLVPCGGCLICRKYKGLCWSGRILLEQMTTKQPSWFVTLTYNDEKVPRTVEGDTTLDKKGVTQWLDNYRKRNADFRRYLVGEYGDNTGRAHYHLALYPAEDFDVRHFADKWSSRGFASFSPLQSRRALYLAKYTVKKLTSWDDARLLPGQQPEFRSSSRSPAIGDRAWKMLAEAYTTRQGSAILAQRGDIERSVRIDGRMYPLDDWMKRKMREHLGIPLLHTERLNHKGYYQCHQTAEHERNPELYDLEVYRHRQKAQIKRTQTQNV